MTFVILLMLAAAHCAVMVLLLTHTRSAAMFFRFHLPSFLAAWGAYLVYEAWYIPRNCTGECNIRVDLLFIYPYLLFVTVCALIAFARRRKAADT